jgi:dihydrofolate reductase/thymidylate synthase|tara:strand:- start:3613 stop:5187 length:1575 start_codon:yes stop_codon:yes gene_type:complete
MGRGKKEKRTRKNNGKSSIINNYLNIIFVYIIMENYNYINFIVACDNKGGIGKEGKLPWQISEDMKYFQSITNGNIVVMGKTTYFSIPDKYRPLSNRLNLVLTNDVELLKNNHNKKNLKFFNNKDPEKNSDLIRLSNIVINNPIYNKKDLFIIGGEKIYNMYFNLLNNFDISQLKLNKIYLTHINKDYKCDTFFPKLEEDYELIKYSDKKYNKKENSFYRFLEYQKNSINKVDNEEKYLNIAKNIIDNGNYREDRTNTGTYSIFGTQMRFNISDNIPILTTKKIPFKTCVHELLWFLNGDTNNKNLQKKKVRIWDGNSSREFLDNYGLSHLEEGDCGACYGFQWRHFGAKYIDCHTDYTDKGFDQIKYVLNLLKTEPYSRRIFLSAWNSADLDKTCLPPCHVSIQFFVENIGDVKYLSGHMYQRSADWFLGEPFNILSYTILIYLFAKLTDMKPKELIISTGDTHIYSNHIEQIKEQMSRSYLTKPKLWINPDIKNKKLDEITIDDFDLIGYFSHPVIKGIMAV